jgi:uncharacterized protein YbjT (DUF2867 family)
MKIVVTGSLGRISSPLAKLLIQSGHEVTIISSKQERAEEIEALGAKPAIGSIEDVPFLTQAFTGADIVYLMEPPMNYFDPTIDAEIYWTSIAASYIKAVQQSGVKKLVHLSSIGAHTDMGNGMLAIHHNVEQMLKELPADVAIKFMRPVGFYYNMFAFIPGIKKGGVIVQNYGGDEKEPWVSPVDIAATIAEEVDKPFEGRAVRYIASDEAAPNEVARILGAAIGKPDLEWMTVSDAAFETALTEAGFTPKSAKGFTEMNAARLNGLYNDYKEHKPILGKIKLTDFAKDFAAVYNRS